MANDLMREGPRGSSKQAPWAGPQQFVFSTIGAGVVGTVNMVKATASTAEPIQGYFNTVWELVGLQLIVTEATATNPVQILVGDAGNAGASANAFADYQLTTGNAAGTIIDIPLNGAGVGNKYIGDPTELPPNLGGRLSLSYVASAGDGRFKVSALLKPVFGRYYAE